MSHQRGGHRMLEILKEALSTSDNIVSLASSIVTLVSYYSNIKAKAKEAKAVENDKENDKENNQKQ